MTSATNRKSIRRSEKAIANLESTRIDFIRGSLDTKAGRTFFFHLLADCHVFESAPTFDSNRDYFQMGDRNNGLRILSYILLHCPDRFTLMQQEENARILAINAADSNAAGDAVSTSDAPDTSGYPGGLNDPARRSGADDPLGIWNDA